MPPTETHPHQTLYHSPSTLASPQIIRAGKAFVVVAAAALGITLVTGATQAFNLLIWVLFTGLSLACAAAVFVSPQTLDDLWHELRRRPLVIQAVVWLLFLPLMIALYVWERPWPASVRIVLVLALNAWTVFFLFPHG